MAHINYNRNVSYTNRYSLYDLLPQNNYTAGFAALCGSDDQRRQAGLLGISRCAGRIGIVVLQNDPVFAASLSAVRSPVTHTAPRILNVNPIGGDCFYDPFYGSSDKAVLNTLIPSEGAGYGAVPPITLRGNLSAYLDIMRSRFEMDATPFGDYPFSLDLLRELVRMPVHQLNDSVLRFLPPQARERIYSTLSRENAQQQVCDLVDCYAKELNNRLWRFRGFGGHTQISVIEAVRRRQLIVISVPTGNETVMRTVAEELNELREYGVPFLLTVCNVPLASSPQIRRLFTDAHRSLNYSTGLLEENISRFSDNSADIASLLTEQGEVLIFQSRTASQAAPLSDAFGSYYRIVTENSRSRHRRPFGLFSSRSVSVANHETLENNISADELMRLGNGAVLCGNLYPTPIVIGSVT